jgi:pyruvate dehydrogenase E2 component (dihydrolipoyllysine-residue acetyltransferase)
MAVELLMPRLGWTMEEGVFVQWLKRDGEQVRPGDLLYTIEGDKASDDVESFDGGILRIPPDAPPPGTTLPVGALLGYIVQPGEPAPFETKDEGRKTKDERRRTDHEPPAVDDERRTTNGDRRQSHRKDGPAISPRARRVAGELEVSWAGLTGSGRSGRIVERDVRAAAGRQAQPAPVRATPLARRVAQELGVDLGQLAADAPGRRFGRADVEQAASAAAPQAPAPAATPLSSVRKLTAARLAESARAVVPVTLTTDADASELVRLRGQIAADLAASGLPAPTYTDLIVKLVAVALGEHPALNASFADDGIVQHAAAHIGIAVDAERGLLVPVVRDAGRKSLQQIAAESARLIAEARAGQSRADDLRGGTFTISNLGMYQIDAFTPIVNLPECAILGVGRIQARPVVIDEQAETVAVRRMMALSLTFDHRAVDGGPAARFLNRVREFVERPYLWLTR